MGEIFLPCLECVSSRLQEGEVAPCVLREEPGWAQLMLAGHGRITLHLQSPKSQAGLS